MNSRVYIVGYFYDTIDFSPMISNLDIHLTIFTGHDRYNDYYCLIDLLCLLLTAERQNVSYPEIKWLKDMRRFWWIVFLFWTLKSREKDDHEADFISNVIQRKSHHLARSFDLIFGDISFFVSIPNELVIKDMTDAVVSVISWPTQDKFWLYYTRFRIVNFYLWQNLFSTCVLSF